ncbi:MAG: FtsX-like permease family protein [Candidatus Thorarchaeota archaeon]
MWPVAYALSSLRRNSMRNMGITLIMAFAISLAPAVMNWSATEIRIETEQFVNQTVYQLGFQPELWEGIDGFQGYLQAEALCDGHPWVRRVDRVLSTACLVDGHLWPDYLYALNENLLYAKGMKDARVIFATNDLLQTWMPQFDWRGKMQIDINETVVSQRFVDYLREAMGKRITINSTLDIDIILGAHGPWPYRVGNRRSTIGNLTVVGIFESRLFPSVLANAFPSMNRQFFDPFNSSTPPVLDLEDSVIIRTERVPPEVVDEISKNPFFDPSTLVQIDADRVLDSGEGAIGENIFALLEQINEIPGTRSWGVEEIQDLQQHVSTYLQSRILVLLGLPTQLIALLLAVNTTEISVTGRSKELSLLRTKGASFNQVLSSYLWESIILCLLGLVLGTFLSFVIAAVLGSSTGLLQFNPVTYGLFLSELRVHPLGIIISGLIAMALPLTYMLHLARNIDAHEAGQPTETIDAASIESARTSKHFAGLLLIVVTVNLMPYVVAPVGVFSVAEVLLATGLLYFGVFVGTRFFRQILAPLMEKSNFLSGEKSLYVSRSLLRRKGRILPLLVVLGLILATMSMSVVQLDGFENNLESEMEYAIGADLRIEIYNASLDLKESIQQSPGVYQLTPVLELNAEAGGQPFFLEGLDALKYSKIGKFREESFMTSDPADVLSSLNDVSNGIIISEYYGVLWNKSIGDALDIAYYNVAGYASFASFVVVSFMKSAPGFGDASHLAGVGDTISRSFGFQRTRGGFAIANLEYLLNISSIDRVNLFLADALEISDLSYTTDFIRQEFNAEVYSPSFNTVEELSFEANLFLGGLRGLISVSVIISVAMALFATTILLGSVVSERSVEFAVLRAVGATRKQVLHMVFQEFAGTLLITTVISVLVGAAFGFSMALLTFGVSPLVPSLVHTLSAPVGILGVMIGSEALALILVSYIAVRRMSGTNPARSLRNM